MSGGSYNYLCYKDSTEIGSQSEHLEKMIARLRELNAYTAARDTERISEFFIELNEKIDKLRDIWHAVEWYDSGDWSESQCKEVLYPNNK